MNDIQAISELLVPVRQIQIAYVFGSLAKQTATASSDADVAIQAFPPLNTDAKIDLIGQIAGITGRAVDLINLNEIGDPLLGEILTKGIQVKGSKSQHIEILLKRIYQNEDFSPLVKRIMHARRQKWINR